MGGLSIGETFVRLTKLLPPQKGRFKKIVKTTAKRRQIEPAIVSAVNGKSCMEFHFSTCDTRVTLLSDTARVNNNNHNNNNNRAELHLSFSSIAPIWGVAPKSAALAV